MLVEPAQTLLCGGAVGIESQHILQAHPPIAIGFDDAAQPQPALLVLFVQFHDQQKFLTRFVLAPRADGSDALLEEIIGGSGGGRHGGNDSTGRGKRRVFDLLPSRID